VNEEPQISENDQKELKIENIAANSVEDFLCFIYTGKLSENFNAKEVFALAARFKVDTLKFDCEEKISNELDESNVFQIFNMGQRYSSECLKRKAFEEIKKMFVHFKLPNSIMDHPEEIKKLEEIQRDLNALAASGVRRS
jgi:hypothetical protein